MTKTIFLKSFLTLPLAFAFYGLQAGAFALCPTGQEFGCRHIPPQVSLTCSCFPTINGVGTTGAVASFVSASQIGHFNVTGKSCSPDLNNSEIFHSADQDSQRKANLICQKTQPLHLAIRSSRAQFSSELEASSGLVRCAEVSAMYNCQ